MATLLVTTLVSACVPALAPAPPTVVAPPPPAAPRAAALRPAPPPPRADWRNAPQSGGTWKWGMDGEQSVARFGEPGAEPLATLSCEPATRSVTLRLAGNRSQNSGQLQSPVAAVSGDTTLIVTTTGARQMFTAAADAGGGGGVTLVPRDRILDAMAFSRGRFMLEMPGASTLYLPSWPELSRVIEDCR